MRVAGVALLALLALAGVATARPPDPDDPRYRLVLHAGDRWLRAPVHEFCLSTEAEGSGCRAPSPPPSSLPRLRLGPREVLELRPGATASAVRASWSRRWMATRGTVEARRAADGHWRVRLPRRARTARYLRLHVEYGAADFVDFYVSIRVRAATNQRPA